MTDRPPESAIDLVDSVVGARPAMIDDEEVNLACRMIDAIPIIGELQEAITRGWAVNAG